MKSSGGGVTTFLISFVGYKKRHEMEEMYVVTASGRTQYDYNKQTNFSCLELLPLANLAQILICQSGHKRMEAH